MGCSFQIFKPVRQKRHLVQNVRHHMQATVVTWYCSVPVPEKMSTTFSIPERPCLHPLTIPMLLPSVERHAAVPTLSLDLEGTYCCRSAFQSMHSALILLVVSVPLKWPSLFPPWGVIHLCRFDVLDTPQNPS